MTKTRKKPAADTFTPRLNDARETRIVGTPAAEPIEAAAPAPPPPSHTEGET